VPLGACSGGSSDPRLAPLAAATLVPG
jgi:hypothetical protein